MFGFFLSIVLIWVKGLSSGPISWSLHYLSEFWQPRSDSLHAHCCTIDSQLFYLTVLNLHQLAHLPTLIAWVNSGYSLRWSTAEPMENPLALKVCLETGHRQNPPKTPIQGPWSLVKWKILQFNGNGYWTPILFSKYPNVSLAQSVGNCQVSTVYTVCLSDCYNFRVVSLWLDHTWFK